MEISIVCNLNQARSKIAEEFCARQFPEVKFRSYGINAAVHARIPEVTLQLLHKWQLPRDLYARPVGGNIDKMRESKVIIAADENVKKHLVQAGLREDSIFSATEVKVAELLRPVDPVSLAGIQFEFEIAKFVLACSQIVNKYLDSSIRTDVLVPVSLESHAYALDRANELAQQQNGLVLDFSDERQYKYLRVKNAIDSNVINVRSIFLRNLLRKIEQNRTEERFIYPTLLRIRNSMLDSHAKSPQRIRKIIVIAPVLFNSSFCSVLSVLVASLSTDKLYFIENNTKTNLIHLETMNHEGLL